MLVWDSCLIFFVWKFSHCSTSFSLTRLEGSRGRTTLPAQGWWATGPQWLSTSIYKVKLRPCQNSLRAKPSNQSMPMCSCSGTTVLLPQKRRHVPIFVCLNQTCMVLCFSSLFEWNWWTFLRWQTTNGTVTVFVADKKCPEPPSLPNHNFRRQVQEIHLLPTDHAFGSSAFLVLMAETWRTAAWIVILCDPMLLILSSYYCDYYYDYCYCYYAYCNN